MSDSFNALEPKVTESSYEIFCCFVIFHRARWRRFFLCFWVSAKRKMPIEMRQKSLPDKNGVESRFNENYTRRKRVQIKNLEFFTYPVKDARRKRYKCQMRTQFLITGEHKKSSHISFRNRKWMEGNEYRNSTFFSFTRTKNWKIGFSFSYC